LLLIRIGPGCLAVAERCNLLQIVVTHVTPRKMSQFVANSCKALQSCSFERPAILRQKTYPKSAFWAVICRLAESLRPGVRMAKPAHSPVDDNALGEQEPCANSRNNAVLEFWQRRSGKQLSLSIAREMQSNVEGLIGLLAQWDREDCAKSSSADRLREQHVSAKG
jgi:hypothetical protein